MKKPLYRNHYLVEITNINRVLHVAANSIPHAYELALLYISSLETKEQHTIVCVSLSNYSPILV